MKIIATLLIPFSMTYGYAQTKVFGIYAAETYVGAVIRHELAPILIKNDVEIDNSVASVFQKTADHSFSFSFNYKKAKQQGAAADKVIIDFSIENARLKVLKITATSAALMSSLAPISGKEIDFSRLVVRDNKSIYAEIKCEVFVANKGMLFCSEGLLNNFIQLNIEKKIVQYQTDTKSGITFFTKISEFPGLLNNEPTLNARFLKINIGEKKFEITDASTNEIKISLENLKIRYSLDAAAANPLFITSPNFYDVEVNFDSAFNLKKANIRASPSYVNNATNKNDSDIITGNFNALTKNAYDKPIEFPSRSYSCDIIFPQLRKKLDFIPKYGFVFDSSVFMNIILK